MADDTLSHRIHYLKGWEIVLSTMAICTVLGTLVVITNVTAWTPFRGFAAGATLLVGTFIPLDSYFKASERRVKDL